MDANPTPPLILYTSNFCGHAQRVERFLANHHVPLRVINIDREPGERERLIELNGGYASVPTVIFPDGARLVEPSLSLLRQNLGLDEAEGRQA